MGVVYKLANFKPDNYVDSLNKAFATSVAHMDMMDEGSIYTKEDIAREEGYQEAILMAKRLYRKK